MPPELPPPERSSPPEPPPPEPAPVRGLTVDSLEAEAEAEACLTASRTSPKSVIFATNRSFSTTFADWVAKAHAPRSPPRGA